MVRIKIGTNGRLGNKLFQYMYCRHLQILIPSSVVEGFQIPEFNLVSPDLPLDGRILEIRDGHRHNMQSIAYLLNSGIYDNLYFDGYVQRLEYYPNRDFCAGFFPTEHKVDRTHLGADSLLINVRGFEILSNAHPDYGPVPVDFFSQIVDQTRLSPVIMGQLGDDDYSREIRHRLAGCKFIASKSAISDFELVRNATNIVFGVSSFSWMAAWLSRTAERIYMPVSGYYHPAQRPDVDLLPVNDDRYRFYEFPVEKWYATNEQMARLLSSGRTFRQLTRAQAKALIV